jgi:signal transduction histidine kinase
MDRTRITQVIGNLLQNAIIHTPQGGTITVTEEIIGDEMVVSVSDTGSGIPAEACPHIFERFYRYDKSRSRVSGGTGLGLAIARQLVQVHGGRINVISQEGEGSCFTFYLPLKYGGPVQQRRPARFPAQIEADTRA